MSKETDALRRQLNTPWEELTQEERDGWNAIEAAGIGASNDGKTDGPPGSAEAPLGRSEHIPTPEGRGGETLTTLLRRAKQTLCVPAAEYVPAMGDAMLLLDKAIQMSYQTDPNWLLSSPRVEEVRRMREALTALRSLVREGGVPRYTVTPGAALNSVIEELVDPALSPPVG
jgi:hypothetical protein